jgi:membrane protein CcdC involved in cytochrome C biogenesis
LVFVVVVLFMRVFLILITLRRRHTVQRKHLLLVPVVVSSGFLAFEQNTVLRCVN